MKVGMLTSHASMNYGGLLQAYALKTTIARMGHECDIINYKPQMHNVKEHPVKFVLERQHFVQKAWFGLTRLQAFRQRRELIDRFRADYLSPSPRKTVTVGEIPREAKEYDVVCCGSDQLWNLNQKDNENRAYLLDFDRSNTAITYAVSFGDGLREKYDETVASLPLIRHFDSIAVREVEGQDFLAKNGVKAELTLDPTLLAEDAIWDRFRFPACVEYPYILVYGFENAYQKYDELVAAARRLSDCLGLPVVNPVMNPDMAKARFVNKYACGPREFFNLVEHASFVCTNSYHGTIFSFLLDRPFIAVFDEGSPREGRKATLLDMLHMESRGVSSRDPWNMEKLMQVDYAKARKLLQEERERSMNYLAKALTCKEGKGR